MIKVAGFQFESFVDGEGIRNVLFVQGCKHYCPHCHNKETWDLNGGKEFTLTDQEIFINKCKNDPLVEGLTLSGGEPLLQSKELLDFVLRYKKELPDHNIWLYTGYLYQNIFDNKDNVELLKYIDVVVDGLFILDKKDVTLKFRGSSNQRIIDNRKSSKDNIVNYLE